MNKIMVVAALAAVAAGCTTVQVTREGDYNDAQMKMSDESSNPYRIDWNVRSERVKAEGKSSCWFWFFTTTDGYDYASPGFTFDSGVAAAKDSATFRAAEDAKSDAIMGCMYRVTKMSKWLGIYKEVTAEVTGFPADVKGISLIKDRPVAIDKNLQIVRLPAWESLDAVVAPPPKAGGSVLGF